LKSKAGQTFIGDYNYLVVTNELWEAIQADQDLGWKYYHEGILIFDELSHNIGITSVKKAKKRNVTIGTRATVLESMVRSLNREVGKLYKLAPFWELKANES
jgi:isocitrate dehydrogenase